MSLEPSSDWAARRGLDALVTKVAAAFMPATAATLQGVYEEALRMMLEFFDVDTSVLRRHDDARELSILVAEWPPRESIPSPDPLGEVPFDADPVFSATRTLTGPLVMRPTDAGDAYQQRVEAGSGVPQVAVAVVPLLRGDRTSGVLAFIKFGDRAWDVAETNALQTVASLVVQLEVRIEAQEELRFHAYHDELTDLPNRRALLDELQRRSDDRAPTTLLFIDLDRFKGVNDTLGHVAGDRLLSAVAERIAATCAVGVLVARLAGDEFVVLLDDSAEAGLALAGVLLAVIAEPVAISGNQVSRSASIGVAAGGGGPAASDQLLGDADVALRSAKELGGNCAVLFDGPLREDARERAELEIDLRNALRNGDLSLHYQPEIDLVTGAVVGIEALVRWQHPARGLLNAGSFITVVEECGLSVQLGAWVTAEACRQMGEWSARHADLEFTMRVNLSPAQLGTRDIVDLVERCLRDNDLPGRLLCFEITEHALLQDLDRAVQTLVALTELGVGLAIDDFGTGYSSMSQLKHLPVDTIKIDQSFVAGLATDPRDRAIVDATILLADAFGLDVVAEGIETPEMVTALRSVGCRRGQGYLLGRPAPAADLAALLARGNLDVEALMIPAEPPGRAGSPTSP